MYDFLPVVWVERERVSGYLLFRSGVGKGYILGCIRISWCGLLYYWNILSVEQENEKIARFQG